MRYYHIHSAYKHIIKYHYYLVLCSGRHSLHITRVTIIHAFTFIGTFNYAYLVFDLQGRLEKEIIMQLTIERRVLLKTHTHTHKQIKFNYH